MVYDCFIFFNELDLLELRLNILDKVVDYFVICESSITHSGLVKKLYIRENWDRFSKWHSKIIYLPVINMPENFISIEDNALEPFIRASWLFNKVTEPYYAREFYQREFLRKALIGCNKDDIIILSDLDEIPNPETLRYIIPFVLRDKVLAYALKMNSYYYYLNMLKEEGWTSAKVFTGGKVKYESLNDLRHHRSHIPVEMGGWHFSFLGDADQVRKKITAYSHHTMGTEAVLEQLEYRIKEGIDPFNRGELKRVEIDGTFPQYLLDNLEQYKHMIL